MLTQIVFHHIAIYLPKNDHILSKTYVGIPWRRTFVIFYSLTNPDQLRSRRLYDTTSSKQQSRDAEHHIALHRRLTNTTRLGQRQAAVKRQVRHCYLDSRERRLQICDADFQSISELMSVAAGQILSSGVCQTRFQYLRDDDWWRRWFAQLCSRKLKLWNPNCSGFEFG